MSDLGSKIKNIRVKNNYTQAEIADLLNVNRSTISHWEANTKTPSTDNLMALAKIVGVTLDYFQDAPPERTMFQLMAQLESVFTSADISESDKDKAYQDIMQIYLDSKKAPKQNPASKENTLLNIKEE